VVATEIFRTGQALRMPCSRHNAKATEGGDQLALTESFALRIFTASILGEQRPETRSWVGSQSPRAAACRGKVGYPGLPFLLSPSRCSCTLQGILKSNISVLHVFLCEENSSETVF